MKTLTPSMALLSVASTLACLLTACAGPQQVQHVPVAVECPKRPRPPAELRQPLPTLDLIDPSLLPKTRR